jgi:hypothetical protein
MPLDAHLTECARRAAVAHILKLHQDAVRIGEVKFRGSVLCSTSIFSRDTQIRHEWTCLAARNWFDPEIGESLEDFVSKSLYVTLVSQAFVGTM